MKENGQKQIAVAGWEVEVKNRLEDPVTEAGMGVFRKTFLTETVSHFLYFNNISIAYSVKDKIMQRVHH